MDNAVAPAALAPQMAMFDLQSFLAIVGSELGVNVFEEGKCHDLAITLLQLTQTGSLAVCMKHTRHDDYEFSTYSHMVYVDNAGEVWDIRGSAADIRWENRWTLSEYGKNEYDEIIEFEWLPMPAEGIESWLSPYQCAIDTELCDRLVLLGKQALTDISDVEAFQQIATDMPS